MRSLAFTLVLCATGFIARDTFGNGMVVVPTAPQARTFLSRSAPASVGGESKHGFLHRLHGKSCCSNPSTSPAMETRLAAAATSTGAMFADMTRPCYNDGNFSVDARGLVTAGPGHCFPNCYTGTPCTCCDHHVKYLNPNTPRGRAYVEMSRGNMPPYHPSSPPLSQGQPVAYPGLMSRILRKHP